MKNLIGIKFIEMGNACDTYCAYEESDQLTFTHKQEVPENVQVSYLEATQNQQSSGLIVGTRSPSKKTVFQQKPMSKCICCILMLDRNK